MRNPDGTFMKGFSGNYAGRPKNFRSRYFEQLAQDNADNIKDGVDRLFRLDRQDDFNALKVMLEFFGCKARAEDARDEEQDTPMTTGLPIDALKQIVAIIEAARVQLKTD